MAERAIFNTRTYQRPWRVARRDGCKFFIKLWHRRAGKDRDCLAFTSIEMLQRVGVYYHVFPSLNQGRRDLWDNVIQETRDGVETSHRMIDMFPKELLAEKPNETEMQVKLRGGSIYQVVGAENDEAIERLRGPNPIGIIFSEFAHGNKMPKAWDTLSPVIAQNRGWVCFAYTPNGMNHGYDLWTRAQNNVFDPVKNPLGFYSQKLTIEDTQCDAAGEDGSPVVTLDMIEAFKRQGKRPEFLRQEYWCDFTAYQHGTIYGDLMMRAEQEGRIKDLPYIVNLPVGIICDLGKSDALAVWFYQVVGNAIHFIDYWEDTQKSMHDVARMLRMKPYLYGRIVLPWDGQTAADYLEQVGFANVNVNKRTDSLQASIEEVRREFSRFYFAAGATQRGRECLRKYARKYDDDKMVFTEKPIHDQFSHGADALRTGVEGGFEPLAFSHEYGRPVRVESSFDPCAIYPSGGN